MNEAYVASIVFSKDTKEALSAFRQLETISEEADALYPYWPTYIQALSSPQSCVRGRGFKMIVRNSQWDREGRTARHLPEILAVLEDAKPTVVRQCLAVLPLLGRFQPALIPALRDKLGQLNPFRYKETMHSLLQKDIASALDALAAWEKP